MSKGALLFVLLGLGAAAPGSAQTWVSLDTGYSRARDFGIGVSLAHWLSPQVRARLSAMEFFQDGEGNADPDVEVDASYRHVHLDVLYHAQAGGLGPYAGVGGGWSFSRLALTRNGEFGEADRTRWGAALVAGMRLHFGSWAPFGEARRLLDLDQGWFFTLGAEYSVR